MNLLCKYYSLLLVLFLTGFTAMSQNINTIKIAFSKIGTEEKYKLYPQWILSVAPDVEITDMAGMKPSEAVSLLGTCSGLVLTGGPDIFPGLYKKEKEMGRCEKVDRVRDSEEIMLIKKALELRIPIFAICRGAQLLNAYHGGSLIIDIPTDYGSAVSHRMNNPEGAQHTVTVEPRSYFYEILKVNEGKVNSFHHQGVEKLAPEFVPQVKTPDNLIEAFTWKDPAGKSFLLAVQWHPERMKDPLFSKKLAEVFIEEVRKYNKY